MCAAHWGQEKRSKSKPSGKGRTSKASPTTARTSHAIAPPTVSGRWLVTAIAVTLVAALLCAWATLCILFWQGSWQLLYHPASAVERTPASVSLQFDSIGFATTTSGDPQLRGWWLPAASPARYTAVYLHGATGNLGDTVDALARLHALGLNVFAFDYRGYGQSHFAHPSEVRWREDADSAIRYLTETRHTAPRSLILVGKDLGANLALEISGHASGSCRRGTRESARISNNDNSSTSLRARIVPARLLVSDNWDTNSAASNVLIPSLWFYWTAGQSAGSVEDTPAPYQKTPARKRVVWLTNSLDEPKQFNFAITSWLDELQTRR